MVLGKYLGALGLYTVALAFSLAHLVVLAYLGDPDPGLMVSTYLGYWLMGAFLVGIGLLGSMLSLKLRLQWILRNRLNMPSERQNCSSASRRGST